MNLKDDILNKSKSYCICFYWYLSHKKKIIDRIMRAFEKDYLIKCSIRCWGWWGFFSFLLYFKCSSSYRTVKFTGWHFAFWTWNIFWRAGISRFDGTSSPDRGCVIFLFQWTTNWTSCMAYKYQSNQNCTRLQFFCNIIFVILTCFHLTNFFGEEKISWLPSKNKHYHLQVQANPKKMAQKNRCYF